RPPTHPIKEASERERPKQARDREAEYVVASCALGYAEEGGQYEGVGEEDGVVHESLAGHEHDPQNGALGVHLEHRPGDGPKPYALPLLDRDAIVLVYLGELFASPMLSYVVLYVLCYLFGLVGLAVGHKPTRALGDEATGKEDQE